MKKWDDEDLKRFLPVSSTMVELIVHLNGTYAGNHLISVWRRISELGLNTSHLNGRKSIRKEDDEYLRKGEYVSSKKLRSLLKKHKSYMCSGCGNNGSHKGESLTLQVDHEDGDKLNNELKNLRWLCPNCHSQTKTYAKVKSGTVSKPIVTIPCGSCGSLIEIEEASFRSRRKKGQNKFFCNLKCSGRSKVTDEKILAAYEELKSFSAVGRRFEISPETARIRLKKISLLSQKVGTESSPADGSNPSIEAIYSGNRVDL